MDLPVRGCLNCDAEPREGDQRFAENPMEIYYYIFLQIRNLFKRHV